MDQQIISFGKFISGQTLGNELLLLNKSDKEQSFTVMIDQSGARFAETAKDLLGEYCCEDLPFEPSFVKNDQKMAVNSERKFNCWSIENPACKTLQKSITLSLQPKQS